MCFAPEADLVGGVLISGAGVDALRHVRHRREWGLALLPLLFGLHQIVEAGVWWGLDGTIPEQVGTLARDLYLLIAFGLPLLVPVVVRAFEVEPWRRRIMTPFVVVGAVATGVLMTGLAAGPATAEACGRYLSYTVGDGAPTWVSGAYVFATCGPLLLSGTRALRVFGVANLAAVAVLGYVLSAGFISLWCAWAAVFSLVVVAHLRSRRGADAVEPLVPI